MRPAPAAVRAALLAATAAAAVFAPDSARAATLAPGDLLAVLAEQNVVRIAADGSIETLFSAPAAGLQTVYGIAVEPSGRILALTVGGGTSLVRVDPADGSHALVATLPAFGLPFSLAIDRKDTAAFFVDYSGDVFRVELATGAVTTIVSLPSSGVASFALALAPDGALYVSDDAQDRVLRIDPASGATETIAEGVELGGFYRAHGIDVDRDGRILGTRYDPPAVLRIDPATGAQEVVAEGGLLDGPVEIEIERDGSVRVGDLWDGDVVRVDPATGAQSRIDTPYLLTGLAIVPYPECGNGRDDDGDGLVDWPADPGCSAADAPNESPPCQDGIDDDGATGIDFDGGAAANGGVALDVPDPQCTTPWRSERARSCGIGAELVAALGLLSTRLGRPTAR